MAAAAVIVALFATPLAFLLLHDLGLGTELVDVLRDEHFARPLGRTLVLATTVATGATALGTALAWLVVRTDLPGRRVWRIAVPLPLVIPSFVGAFALLAAFAPGGLADTVLGFDQLPRIEGFWAATTVLTMLTYPYVYFPVAARLASLPPSLEETARALGRSPREVFTSIVLPQCAGAMWAGALLVFLYSLSEFGAVQLLHYDTLTRAIFSARLFDRDVALALSLVLGVAALAVAVAERMIARRRVHTEVVSSGVRPICHELGAWRMPALTLISFVVGVALVVPTLVLVHWTVRGVFGDAQLRAGELLDPMLTTAGLGVVTAVLALAILLPVAFLTVRYRSVAGETANAIVVSGFALPGLVLALSMVFFVLSAPAWIADRLYQTYALLVFAYAVHFGSQALRASQVAVGGIPRRVEDAARSLGAGRIRRLLTVQLPLMRGGLLAGGGLVLLSTMKELPATLVLAPIETKTLATQIWGATEDGFFAQAGLAALVLLALSAALTWALIIRRTKLR
ncbi:MAG: ABC transporter permease [Actinomycetota bacterium]